MTEERLYQDKAELYDAIYASKPYGDEAQRLHDVLASLGVGDGARVLEAACGTGSYLRELARWYEVSGFDKNAAMLAVARRKVPSVPLFEADLRSFAVEQPVDAALCLFSSIGYLHDDEALARSLGCFARVVRPGGVLILEPFVGAHHYRDGSTFLQTHEGPELKCVRASVSRRVGDLAVIDFAWLVLRDGVASIEHFTETHTLALYDPERLDRAVAAAGFDRVTMAAHLVGDRTLVVARQRVSARTRSGPT
jgi:daunosaminyl-N,N-dimethyltransferase/N-dimethyltransferase